MEITTKHTAAFPLVADLPAPVDTAVAVYPRLPSKQLVPICFFFCSCGLRLGGSEDAAGGESPLIALDRVQQLRGSRSRIGYCGHVSRRLKGNAPLFKVLRYRGSQRPISQQ
ncbi:hypothetical protein EYF80_054758 [Liparis tanakae]|uniref:Uncharacterized protein n=1 Tax=Liparis tanakae TaxID=230148 RepID=A0A4Z2F1R3_9TELE|nr:hypothetical protein EYF80_054758 [Liparis tanakae]